jgi:hypothetical protein
LDTVADETSPVGDYVIDVSGVSSSNYNISFAPGTLSLLPAPLTITADSFVRDFGLPNPTLTSTYDGFVLGEDATDLSGSLVLSTGATQASPSGFYLINASGQTSGNYDIAYVPGVLLVAPWQAQVGRNNLGVSPHIFAQNPPLTPGDAAFRTSAAWTGAALGDPFTLSYSLGKVKAAPRPCGLVNTGRACGQTSFVENYWTSQKRTQQ